MADTRPTYVADTHALLWYLTADKRLGDKARGVLDAVKADSAVMIIPAVALAEILMIVEKGRVVLPMTRLDSAIDEWKSSRNIHLSALTIETVFQARQLTQIPDIFDRLIVAEALALNAPLLTRDPEIVDSKLVTVIW
jgi:PIN domain nuclease of toxin-antitoxin system